MAEKKNVFMQFALSLYSFKDYPGLSRSHGGKVFLYSLLLVVVTYVVTFIIPTAELLPYIFKIDTNLVDEYVPYFEISNGQFYIEEEFYYEDEDSSIIIYATSDQTIPTETAFEILNAYMQGFIITSDEIVMKQAGGGVTNYTFDMMPELSRQDLYELIPVIKVLTVVLYLLVLVGYLAVYMFGTLVCAIIGQLINLVVKAPVTFGSVFKMSAYARTTPIVIKMLFFGFTSFTLNFVLFYVLFGVYMFMGLKAVKREADAGTAGPADPFAPQGADTFGQGQGYGGGSFAPPKDDTPREN